MHFAPQFRCGLAFELQNNHKSSTGTNSPNAGARKVVEASTPSRRSAPNLSSMLSGGGSGNSMQGAAQLTTSQTPPYETTWKSFQLVILADASYFIYFFVVDGNEDLTAQLDLSGVRGNNLVDDDGDGGGGKIVGSDDGNNSSSSSEFLPKSHGGRVVRIVPRQSNL